MIPLQRVFGQVVTTRFTVTSAGKIATLSISNLTGDILFFDHFYANSAQVNIAGFVPGVYIVKVDNVVVGKLVKL